MSPKSNSMPAFPKISPLFPPLALRWVFWSTKSRYLLIISISGRPYWPWKCQPRRGRDCQPEPRGGRGGRGTGGRGARGLHHDQPRRRGEIPTTKLSTGSFLLLVRYQKNLTWYLVLNFLLWQAHVEMVPLAEVEVPILQVKLINRNVFFKKLCPDF